MKKRLKKALILSLIPVMVLAGAGCGGEEESNDEGLLLIALFLLQPNPKVRFANTSNTTENYKLWNFTTTSTCNSTLAYTFTANPVANNVTTEYESVPAGKYDISFNAPESTNCKVLTSGFNFVKGSTYTCSSTTSTITCASP